MTHPRLLPMRRQDGPENGARRQAEGVDRQRVRRATGGGRRPANLHGRFPLAGPLHAFRGPAECVRRDPGRCAMGARLKGERMQMPSIDAEAPTLLPPPSIAPIGLDVRFAAANRSNIRTVALAAFAAGTVVGALVLCAVRTVSIAE